MLNKYLFFILFLGVTSITGYLNAQDTQKKGEDEWEMKQYYFVYLNSPAERPKDDSARVVELQMAHLGHIQEMFEAGKCRLSGPFLDKGETRGIWILDVASKEEAEMLCAEDPFIKNGYLVAVIKPWYGPAGLYVQKKAK